MQNYLKAAWQNPIQTLKIAGGVVVALIVLTVAFQFINSTVQTLTRGEGFGFATSPSSMIGNTKMMYDDMDYAVEEAAMDGAMAQGMPSPMPPREPGYSSGNDAEDFEVTEYSSSFKTQDKEKECTAIANLKSLAYVIFENANEHRTGCSFSFKVEHEHAKEILSTIEELDPENLSANTYTIKRSVENVKSEVEIFNEKLESINDTLESSLSAYDEITKLATASKDAGSLATIIDSKVRLIERLTQERININERLSRLERNQNQQLERLDYTYFHVNVYEDKYVDGKQIKDSWKRAITSFVRDTNVIAQDVTIGLVSFVLYVVQYVLYFFILLFTAKYGWTYARKVWRK